jgi:hypothetical protein
VNSIEPDSLNGQSDLTGAFPFPHLSDWAGDSALFALQGLKSNLADISSSVGEDFVHRVVNLDPIHWQATLLHPAVFAFLAKEPGPWTWEQLSTEVTRDGDAIEIHDLRFWTHPGRHFKDILRSLGRGSRGSDCLEADFISPLSEEFIEYASRAENGLRLVEAVAPGYAADLRHCVHALALVDSNASFRGSSGAIHRGLVFLSPDPSWDATVFAEELVHESTHNLLDLLSLREPLLDGAAAFEEKYLSPFRPDPRHLFGNFHALVVIARLLWLFSAFEVNGIPGQEPWRERRKDYLGKAFKCLQDVRLYQGLSDRASAIIESFVVPTFCHFGSETTGVPRIPTIKP